jgi:hypothetical protein
MDNVLVYFGIGFLFTMFFDISIRELKTSEPLTSLEFIIFVGSWPFVIVYMIAKLIQGNQD